MVFKKFDKGVIGLVSGLVLPLIAMVGFYFVSYDHLDFSVFVNRLLISKLFSAVLSLCVLPNLILFFSFIWTNRNFAARGVLAATFVYAFVVIFFRIID